MLDSNHLSGVGGPICQIVSVSGPTASAIAPRMVTGSRTTVGQFLSVRSFEALSVGVVTHVSLQPSCTTSSTDPVELLQMTLIGSFRRNTLGVSKFERGISVYPAIGDVVRAATNEELRLIFSVSTGSGVKIGTIHQNSSLDAFVDVNDTLGKHFAVLGTTGVGKSSGVAVLLNQILSFRQDLRVFLLDVHNEYRDCFGSRSQIISPSNIKLPFWLFNFDEIVDVIFGGRAGFAEEVDLLSEVIPLAKSAYAKYTSSSERLGKGDGRSIRYTTDIPLPYRIVDLIALLDSRMGKLENRSTRLAYHKLISRIEAVSNDARYSFMFEKANVGGDTMEEVLSHLFRLPINGIPVSVMQLAGFPSEVVDAVVSVICRMAFDLAVWSDGANPMLIVCEEAHRYISSDRKSSFGPTRRAIARIAKEGRKYNVSLGLITQRPAELDATILSQCSTLFVMRLTNDRDQQILQSAVSDTGASLLSFVPSLGTGEAIAFGEGVSLPTRFTFNQLDASNVPRSDMSGNQTDDAAPVQKSLSAVIERWRGLSRPTSGNNITEQMANLSAQASPGLSPTLGLDPDRYKLLRKPADEAIEHQLSAAKSLL
jgi:DNA helicase HerA-like ATPase